MSGAAAAAPPSPPAKALQDARDVDTFPEELAPATRLEAGSSASSPPDGTNAEVSAPAVPASATRRRPHETSPTTSTPAAGRRPSRDYAATRLVNFRIPIDLHDRYKRLVRDVEQTHQRLRHPSLTEVLIGLLEEGPDTPDEVAAVIRRRRASEHGTADGA